MYLHASLEFYLYVFTCQLEVISLCIHMPVYNCISIYPHARLELHLYVFTCQFKVASLRIHIPA